GELETTAHRGGLLVIGFEALDLFAPRLDLLLEVGDGALQVGDAIFEILLLARGVPDDVGDLDLERLERGLDDRHHERRVLFHGQRAHQLNGLLDAVVRARLVVVLLDDDLAARRLARVGAAAAARRRRARARAATVGQRDGLHGRVVVTGFVIAPLHRRLFVALLPTEELHVSSSMSPHFSPFIFSLYRIDTQRAPAR